MHGYLWRLFPILAERVPYTFDRFRIYGYVRTRNRFSKNTENSPQNIHRYTDILTVYGTYANIKSGTSTVEDT